MGEGLIGTSLSRWLMGCSCLPPRNRCGAAVVESVGPLFSGCLTGLDDDMWVVACGQSTLAAPIAGTLIAGAELASGLGPGLVVMLHLVSI